MRWMAIGAAVLLASVSVLAQGRGNAHKGGSGWSFQHSSRVSVVNTAEGPSFTFPDARGHVNYLTKARDGLVGTHLTVTTRTVTTGIPQFHSAEVQPEGCTFPANTRPYLADTSREGWQGEFGRWWSAFHYITLGPGTVTIAAPLDPSQWSDVWGHLGNTDDQHVAEFYRVLGGAGRIGLTFGAGCFYGHGVYVSGGTATFTILEFASD